MRYEWDPAKDAENRRKHGFALEEGIDALEDSRFETWTDDRFEYEEVRSATVGLGKRGILLVISTLRSEDVTRIISVRRANAYEHYCYYHGRP
jgi:uncharacterized DUF497 family protein